MYTNNQRCNRVQFASCAASLSHSPLSAWLLPAITKMTLRKAHPEIPRDLAKLRLEMRNTMVRSHKIRRRKKKLDAIWGHAC